jgi:hypothetical protein
MSRRNEINGVILGILMLFGMHILAGLVIFILGLIIGQIFGNYTFIAVWAVGGYGFLFWQLLYAIPLILWLRRQQKLALMKGVIIGAVITALLNGVCSLLLVR